MAIDPVTAALDIGGQLIERLIPDPQAKAAAAQSLLQMKANGELAELTALSDLAKAQIEVNRAEATSSSLFVAGGRPFVIWVCGAAIANDFILRPFAIFIASLYRLTTQWPQLDMQSLMPLMLGLLGLGAMRSYDKSQFAPGKLT